jgi:hypothetical protein
MRLFYLTRALSFCILQSLGYYVNESDGLLKNYEPGL